MLGPRDAVGGEEVHEFGFRGLEAEGAQRNAELVVVEVAVAVEVEEGELGRGNGGQQKRGTEITLWFDFGSEGAPEDRLCLSIAALQGRKDEI